MPAGADGPDQGTRTLCSSQLAGLLERVRPLGVTTSKLALYLAAYSSDGQYHQRRSHLPCPLGSVQSRTKHASWPTGTRTVSCFSTETEASQARSPAPARERWTVLPTCSGRSDVSTSMLACTMG